MVSYFYPPHKAVGGLRAYSFNRYFRDNGIDVTLLTAVKSYPTRDYYYCRPSKIREWGYKTKILSLLTKLKLDKYFLFPDYYFTWINRAYRKGKKAIRENKIDCIIVTSPPFSLLKVGYKLAKKFNKPLILDYRDPFNGNPFLDIPKPIQWIYSIYEKKIVKKADMIVTVTEQLKQIVHKKTKYPLRKIKVIPNGFLGRIRAPKPKNYLEPFNISIIGSMYGSLKDSFADFLIAYKKFICENSLSPREVTLNFAGNFPRKQLKEMVYNSRTFCYLNDYDYLDKCHLDHLLSESDLTVHFTPRNVEYAISMRLFDYMTNHSHILSIGERGEHTQVFDKVEQQYTVVSDNIEEISQSLTSLYKKWKDGQLDYGCHNGLLNEYNRENLASKYAKIIKEMLKQ